MFHILSLHIICIINLGLTKLQATTQDFPNVKTNMYMGFAWFVCKINGWGDPLTIPQNFNISPQPWHTNRVEPTSYFGKSTTRKYQAPRSPRERDFCIRLSDSTHIALKRRIAWWGGGPSSSCLVFFSFLSQPFERRAKGFTYYHYTMCQSCTMKGSTRFHYSPTLHLRSWVSPLNIAKILKLE